MDSGIRFSSRCFFFFLDRNLNLKVIPIGGLLPKIYFRQTNHITDDSSCFYYFFTFCFFLRDSVLFLRGGKLPAMKITGYDHLPSA